MKSPARHKKPDISPDPAALRRLAEASLRGRPTDQKSDAGAQRLLHELEVHQIELEVQNAELQKARDELEVALEKYTDLYDFAPVGYFSVDESGMILEANLTSAALLGVERSRLINRRLLRFVVPASQPFVLAFLERVFAGTGKQLCEAALLKEGAASFWASFRGTSAISVSGPRKWCRVAVSDITSLKRAEEAQRRMEALALANRELKREIVRRQAVEKSLKKSEQHYSQLLEESRLLQEQLRYLSHRILSAQEEERKRISRELHDEIAQALTGINVQLSTLNTEATVNTKSLQKRIASTQRLVARTVDIVHRFARELRPAVLDDLGLIPALHTFMKSLREQTGIRISLTAFAAVEQVNGDKRTVLYRVAQEALNNATRHARASHAEVRIQKIDGAVCIRIKDNGKGFQVERVLHAKKNRRLGLLGLRERVEMVGGRFTIESTPGRGTTIQAQIPLADGRGTENSLMGIR